jgi:hypothetical protein
MISEVIVRWRSKRALPNYLLHIGTYANVDCIKRWLLLVLVVLDFGCADYAKRYKTRCASGLSRITFFDDRWTVKHG